MPLYKKVANSIGLNRDILWSIYNKFWSATKGPISVIFILQFLLPEDQGLWYTFISLGALKVFAELGFTNIITQFVSHEFANVNEGEKEIEGEEQSVNRFFSLINYSLKLYLIIVPIAILIMIIVGFFYFGIKNRNTLFAWSAFSVIGGLTLTLSLLQAIYKGLDKVKIIQKNLLIGSILMALGNWSFLYLGFKVWALIVGNTLGLLAMLFHIYRIAPFFWKQVIEYKPIKKIYWGGEILKLQWKYAISWISGYFIFNLIVPVLYKYEDPIVAGKYGITYTVLITIVGVSQAWIVTKIPKFNIMLASGKKGELKRFFYKSFLQSLGIQLVLSILVVFIFYVFFKFEFYNERFLSLSYIVLLLLIQIPIQIINFLAVYLRAFKEEPYVVYSFFNALLIAFSLYFILPNYGFNALIYSMTILYWFVMLPYGVYIFFKKQKQYLTKFL